MSHPESSLCEGMYSKLIDNESSYFDEADVRGPAVHHPVPVPTVLGPPRRTGPGLYRTATLCLATLCAALLFGIIALSAHYKNQSQAPATAALQNQTDGQVQMQRQPADVAALTEELSKLRTKYEELEVEVHECYEQGVRELRRETHESHELHEEISKLQDENTALLSERDDLLAKLALPGCVTATPTEAEPTTEPSAPCPSRWLLLNDSCYFISSHSRDWPGSQAYCKEHAAHLAIIHTAEEQTFLWEQLPRGHWNAYWFGISDETTETDWKWVDGTTLVGGFWEEGEPNNHIDEDCGYIVKTRKRERTAVKSWYDAPCTMHWPFICEKEIVVQ